LPPFIEGGKSEIRPPEIPTGVIIRLEGENLAGGEIVGDSTNAESIVYPVLCLGRGRAVAVAHSGDDLTRCPARDLFVDRFYDDMIVVDAASDVFRVKTARTRERMNLVRRIAARLRNPNVTVDLELASEGEEGLSEIRQRVARSVVGDDGPVKLHEATGELRETLERIRDSRSLSELISIFY
jgi:hypothetical protein